MTLKEIICKTILITVPCSIGSKYIVKGAGLLTDTDKWSIRQKAIYNPFMFPMLSASLVSFYLTSSFSYDAPMFSNEWLKNREQSLFEKEQIRISKEQEVYRRQFYSLDTNNDAVIDSIEFIYREEKIKEN